MNFSTIFKLFFAPTNGWRELMDSEPSIPRLFLMHVVPLACIPTLMLVYAGRSDDSFLLIDMLSTQKLMYVGTVFFLVQLISVPIMVAMMRIGQSNALMGNLTITLRHRAFGWVATAIMGIAVAFMLATSF